MWSSAHTRVPWLALHAASQAFAGFLEHAGPYQQVLGKVKAAYEVALTDWIASAADNVHLRQLLAKEERAEVRPTVRRCCACAC